MLTIQNTKRSLFKPQWCSCWLNVGPEFLFKELMVEIRRFKTKKKWQEAIVYLSLLEGGFLNTNDVRFELAVCHLMNSKKDLSGANRDQHPGLLMMQALAKTKRLSYL